jgi:thioredoxin-related protein
MKITSIVCATTMALLGTSFAGGEGWTSDFEAAKKQAAEQKKDLLIDFTGSDWCGWCIKLNDEVFKHDAFKNGVKDSFVLVELDFPKDKSKLSEELQNKNKELSKKYAVRGFPTILLTDADGRPYASTGYQQGGPEKYVAHLNELRGNKTKRDEAFANAEKAQGVEKAKALVAALGAMSLNDAIIANFYGDVAGQITAADPKDETGYTAKITAKKRFSDFQSKLQEFGAVQDHEGALGLIDKTLKESGMGKDETQQVMLIRAAILAEQKKFDEALKAADEAKAFHPEGKMVAIIDNFHKKVEAAKTKAAEKPAEVEDKDAK